ncbi:MAG: MotA/TolQ/ExbB proton channel family protein [Elusimicrobia bacterium]|nr:MotA/TolQ/ExbB proton channel family protein [Elusimicrobiota bacterium]
MDIKFAWKEMFLLGWPVLSALLLCSIISLAIVLERLVYFGRRKVNVKDFFSKIEPLISSGKDAAHHCSILGEPMATIALSAFQNYPRRKESIEMAVDRAVRMEVSGLEKFVPFLGTVASAAPFIGLLGTVIGIIRAFRSLALAGSGGPQVVASGISEALVATAVGLFVAIPSLVAYNYFSTRIRRTTENIEICADGLVELLLPLREREAQNFSSARSKVAQRKIVAFQSSPETSADNQNVQSADLDKIQ